MPEQKLKTLLIDGTQYAYTVEKQETMPGLAGGKRETMRAVATYTTAGGARVAGEYKPRLAEAVLSLNAALKAAIKADASAAAWAERLAQWNKGEARRV